jgi:heterodisulfide reductase subunit A
MEEIRVGVFVCSCGTNIGGVIDVPAAIEYARLLPNVAYAEGNLYSCSQEGLYSLKQNIQEHNLNRVVVASCTPRTHALLFKNACEDAGLNRYLFEFVNIREHCSWVHSQTKLAATEKAKRLIQMGVAKACLLEAQDETESHVISAVLVIGGGIAGMTAARNLSRQGFRVHLVEKEGHLGGRLIHLNRMFPTNKEAVGLVESIVQEVKGERLITLHMPATVNEVSGYVGNFHVNVTELDRECTFDVGTIVVATGADVFRPIGLYGYGQFANVLTQLDLEHVLREMEINTNACGGIDQRINDIAQKHSPGPPTKVPANIAMIQCVGARIPERPYCSRVCCMIALKNATWLKERKPEAQVHILHRDVLTYGVEFEWYYRQAMELGVRFLRYELKHPPQIISNNKNHAEEIAVWDVLRGREIHIPVDLVVLSTPLIPTQENQTISRLLKVPLDESGFFMEAHIKLRPVEFATDGVYVCGTARWPADVSETISQAFAASSKAAIPMRSGVVTAEAITAFSNPAKCMGCGTCVITCPYAAIEMHTQEDLQQVAWVNEVQCKGCGACVVTCPNGAMQQQCFTDQQVLCMIEACASV